MTKRVVRWGATALVAVCAFGMAGISSASITIANPSFESPVVPTDNSWNFTIDSWTQLSGVSGVFNPPSGFADTAIPDGTQTAFLKGGAAISQTLTDVLTADTLYTLEAYVGKRSDSGWTGLYDVELLAGGNVLAFFDETDFGFASDEGGFFIQGSVSYLATDSDPLLGSILAIRLSSGGSAGQQNNFDMVTLDAVSAAGQTGVTPEPATLVIWSLLGGMALAYGWCRKRRAA